MCLMGSSGALAQSCISDIPGPTGLVTGGGALADRDWGFRGARSRSAVKAANTAFLTQSTAFVSAPGNPKPYSERSGVWVRGVGGELTTNNTTTITAAGCRYPWELVGYYIMDRERVILSTINRLQAFKSVGYCRAQCQRMEHSSRYHGRIFGHQGDFVGGNV